MTPNVKSGVVPHSSEIRAGCCGYSALVLPYNYMQSDYVIMTNYLKGWGYVMAKSVFTCFQFLKPTMNKWAQYPAQMEA